ncbi:hypothetical protein PHMEG_00028039 [Phytophthora megakarya]|uniref:COR domain-containing protein n=1 Tax=Phytophthora megakarya TaxID=4795 RepID=A0A225V5H2_9STRA|nr:hypothetical protein PHMEG_00028039 [Phytophthora megakarya]
MKRFFEVTVLLWIRLVLFRQPNARFKVIGTKNDLVENPDQKRNIQIDVNVRLIGFLRDSDRQVKISDDQLNALTEDFNVPLLETTISSSEVALGAIKDTIVATEHLSFEMPITYTQVLELIIKKRRAAKQSVTRTEQLKDMIVPVNVLCGQLLAEVNMETADQCHAVLRTLHALGDILWYEDIQEFKELIILDPSVVLDIVREVVNHSYEDKVGEQYDALRRDGIVQHSLLMSCDSWSALHPNMIPRFKNLLVNFNLAYPVPNAESIDEADMIVPAYWKMKNQPNPADMSVVEKCAKGTSTAKWKYTIPVGISETIYENFVVQCYRPGTDRTNGVSFFESFIPDEFGACIHLFTHDMDRYDDIVIEVAAPLPEIAWEEMRYYVFAMELVLLGYRGLESAKQKSIERSIVVMNRYSQEESHLVTSLMNNPLDVKRLRKTMDWLPPNFEWFLRCTWTKAGALDETIMQERVAAIEKFAVQGEQPPFPAVWTLSHLEDQTMVIRMHSDLSGEISDEPLKFDIPTKLESFVADNQNFIKVRLCRDIYNILTVAYV